MSEKLKMIVKLVEKKKHNKLDKKKGRIWLGTLKEGERIKHAKENSPEKY